MLPALADVLPRVTAGPAHFPGLPWSYRGQRGWAGSGWPPERGALPGGFVECHRARVAAFRRAGRAAIGIRSKPVASRPAKAAAQPAGSRCRPPATSRRQPGPRACPGHPVLVSRKPATDSAGPVQRLGGGSPGPPAPANSGAGAWRVPPAGSYGSAACPVTISRRRRRRPPSGSGLTDVARAGRRPKTTTGSARLGRSRPRSSGAADHGHQFGRRLGLAAELGRQLAPADRDRGSAGRRPADGVGVRVVQQPRPASLARPRG